MKIILLSSLLLVLLKMESCQLKTGSNKDSEIMIIKNKGISDISIGLEPDKYYYSDSITLQLNNIQENSQRDLSIILNNNTKLNFHKNGSTVIIKFKPNKIGENEIIINSPKFKVPLVKKFEVAVPVVVFKFPNYFLKPNVENTLEYSVNGIPQSELNFEIKNAIFENNNGIVKIKPILGEKLVSISISHNNVHLFYHELRVQ